MQLKGTVRAYWSRKVIYCQLCLGLMYLTSCTNAFVHRARSVITFHRPAAAASLRNAQSASSLFVANFNQRFNINKQKYRISSPLSRSHRLFSATTSANEKAADMPDLLVDGEMAKNFDFNGLESSIYEWWEKCGYFQPSDSDASDKKPYVIPMPPPNVTGYLHMGHAMFVALQDILARFHRMRGRPTLWLPGTDHAGIATQLLVERDLKASEGLSRSDIGRDEFVSRVWQWKRDKGGIITKQMRCLGASADWSREKFTLDDDLSVAVTEAFVRLHERGLVYRGSYMVNWSPNLQTAVSDLEVEYSEEEGKLYFFKYMVDGGGAEDFLPVATTRPETILGDTAVCVHPEDDRYKHLVGKMAVVPLTDPPRKVPIIADEYVDREFGTGALKITPGHDQNDYKIGKTHALPIVNILNKDGTINANGGQYAGLDRFECRDKLWADMDGAGLVIKVDPHTQRVPRSQRGGEVIEPIVSTQWFVKTRGMADKALNAVKTGEMQILPQRFEKTWFNWLENIHDWCVSRQLWWGHRIPVYYIDQASTSQHLLAKAEAEAGGGDISDLYFVGRTAEEAKAKAVELLGLSEEEEGGALVLYQEEDVLDTWFSSGLWPFSTLGWPQEDLSGRESDLARFYPANVLETGYDILFFWVARMAMLGLELTDRSPFDTVYLHGLVRDESGQKMSKTKGNVIDPLDTIADFGADALRYSLCTGVTPGLDVPLSSTKLTASSHFVNKLWNIGKFVRFSSSSSIGGGGDVSQSMSLDPISSEELAGLPLPERYIVSRCHEVVDAVTQAIERYEMGSAGTTVQNFLWDDFADWFVEAAKTRNNEEGEQSGAKEVSRRSLLYVLSVSLRLLHPFMPFVTETLWQTALPPKQPSSSSSSLQSQSIMTAPWPQQSLYAKGGGKDGAGSLLEPLPRDLEAESLFGQLQALVRAVRNARAEYKVDQSKRIGAVIKVSGGSALLEELAKEKEVICFLAKIDPDKCAIVRSEGAAAAAAAGEGKSGEAQLVVSDLIEVSLPMSDMVDTEKEVGRLTKQKNTLERQIEGMKKKLTSSGFVDKAPAKLVEDTKKNLNEKIEQLATIESTLSELEATL